MPAWQTPLARNPAADGLRPAYFGVKIINIAPGTATLGLPGLHAIYLLHDAATGVPLALIDGDVLTARRTAATSALAASFMTPEQPLHLLVVGAGRIAQLLPFAYAAVRSLSQVSVWARRPEQAAAAAQCWQEAGFQARAVSDLPAAARSADVVSCATLATEPVLRGAWLRPGAHLDLIGSFAPDMREADDDCFAAADLYLDTLDALRKSGDLMGPLSRGILSEHSVSGTLQQLCRGERTPALRGGLTQRRTVFKSVGHALEDLAAGLCVMGSR